MCVHCHRYYFELVLPQFHFQDSKEIITLLFYIYFYLLDFLFINVPRGFEIGFFDVCLFRAMGFPTIICMPPFDDDGKEEEVVGVVSGTEAPRNGDKRLSFKDTY